MKTGFLSIAVGLATSCVFFEESTDRYPNMAALRGSPDAVIARRLEVPPTATDIVITKDLDSNALFLRFSVSDRADFESYLGSLELLKGSPPLCEPSVAGWWRQDGFGRGASRENRRWYTKQAGMSVYFSSSKGESTIHAYDCGGKPFD